MKIRDHCVEPGEVAAALRHCDGIRSAAVLATGSGTKLLAYVVADGEAAIATAKARLSMQLPDHMVPEV